MSSRRMHLNLPRVAARGEIVTVKTLLDHPMESGERRRADGRQVPRLIVHRVVCTYNGRVAFEADWSPAISANPYLDFDLKATESGRVAVTWTDDAGRIFTAEAAIEVV